MMFVHTFQIPKLLLTVYKKQNKKVPIFADYDVYCCSTALIV